MKHLTRVLFCAMLICMFFTAAVAQTAYAPGTYTASANGNNGPVTLEVTFSDSAIESIAVIGHDETPGLCDAPFERIPAAIVQNQSLAIDAVSGATNTSNAILNAVADCVTQAGGDVDALKNAVIEKAVSSEVVRLEADVVVIGGGGAGTMAAMAAAQSGASVILLEKTAALGGTTAMSGGYMACGNAETATRAEMTESMIEDVEKYLAIPAENETMQRWQDAVAGQYQAWQESGVTTMFDSEQYHMLQTYVDGKYASDTALVETLCNESIVIYNILKEIGYHWNTELLTSTVHGGSSGGAQTLRRVSGDGSKVMISLMAEAAKGASTPASILTEVAGQSLVCTDGRVTGVIAAGSDGTQYEISAHNGVVIATGGFGAGVEVREKYLTKWPYVGEHLHAVESTACTGDGIEMAVAIGADVIDMELVEFFAHVNYNTGSYTSYYGSKTGLMINSDGVRFCDETLASRDMVAYMLEQPNDCLSFLITDATNTYIDAEGKTASGLDVQSLIESGAILRADSLEELAGKMGIDESTFLATVAQFNEMVLTGEDPNFGRTAFEGTEQVLQAPFYATPTSPAFHHTMGGLHIDVEAHVLDTNGEIIPGLYAAGETCGGFHGSCRTSGNAVLEALAEGKIAGENAASAL